MNPGADVDVRREIDTSVPRECWRYRCPQCRKPNWEAQSRSLYCNSCSRAIDALVDAKSGEEIHRDEMQFIGESHWRGPHRTGRGAET